MIIWIGKELTLTIHYRQIAEHGGTSEIREESLLESALARPQQLHAYGNPPPDLADLAAALTYGLARNHPFVDGNKRTAAVCCEAFIELNGAVLTAEDGELYEQYIALAAGTLTEQDFAVWLRARLHLANRHGVHEPLPAYRAKPRRPKTKARSGETEAIALLRSQPWIRPGKGKPQLPKYVLKLTPGEKSLAEIVSEERG